MKKKKKMRTLNNFDIKELVCKEVYNKFGDQAWMFIDEKLIKTLDVVRNEILKRPMTINNWHIGGNYTQRGLRCNVCQLVKSKTDIGRLYLSAHNFGKAIDATVEGIDAEEARNIILQHRDMLPYNIRMEAGVSWLHLDVYDTGEKIYIFKA